MALYVAIGLAILAGLLSTLVSSDVAQQPASDRVASEERITRSGPQLSDFPTPESDYFHGEPAPVDFASYPGSEVMQTMLSEQAKEGPNFAGKYTIISWGCGTSCQAHALVETETGKIISFNELLSSSGVVASLDSTLLIINPSSDFLVSMQNVTQDIYSMEKGALQLLVKIYAQGNVVRSSNCQQLPAEAMNPLTEEIKTFPTLCQVPSGYQLVGAVDNNVVE